MARIGGTDDAFRDGAKAAATLVATPTVAPRSRTTGSRRRSGTGAARKTSPTTSTSGPIADLATTYRAEAHARDQLLFEVGVMDFNKYGGDIIFRVTRPKDKTLVAMAKQGFVFFNYKTSQVVAMPEDFRGKFDRVNWID